MAIFKTILTAACMLLAFTACSNGDKKNKEEMNVNQKETPNEVAGRKNFGAKHAVMTPQPCIMIATYDENQVMWPDFTSSMTAIIMTALCGA